MLLGEPRKRFLKKNFSKLPKKELLRLIKAKLSSSSKTHLVNILVKLYKGGIFNPKDMQGGQDES